MHIFSTQRTCILVIFRMLKWSYFKVRNNPYINIYRPKSRRSCDHFQALFLLQFPASISSIIVSTQGSTLLKPRRWPLRGPLGNVAHFLKWKPAGDERRQQTCPGVWRHTLLFLKQIQPTRHLTKRSLLGFAEVELSSVCVTVTLEKLWSARWHLLKLLPWLQEAPPLCRACCWSEGTFMWMPAEILSLIYITQKKSHFCFFSKPMENIAVSIFNPS